MGSCHCDCVLPPWALLSVGLHPALATGCNNETKRVAELLSQLPSEIDVEGLVQR